MLIFKYSLRMRAGCYAVGEHSAVLSECWRWSSLIFIELMLVWKSMVNTTSCRNICTISKSSQDYFNL